jgi:copper chaperone CopZ
MRTAALSGFIALAVLAGACSNAPSATEAAEKPDGATYVLSVEGMTCADNCAPSVKTSLESIEGVKRVDVSFEEKRAVVVMAEGHSLTTEVADKSFGNDGYFISEISESTGDTQNADPPEAEILPKS